MIRSAPVPACRLWQMSRLCRDEYSGKVDAGQVDGNLRREGLRNHRALQKNHRALLKNHRLQNLRRPTALLVQLQKMPKDDSMVAPPTLHELSGGFPGSLHGFQSQKTLTRRVPRDCRRGRRGPALPLANYGLGKTEQQSHKAPYSCQLRPMDEYGAPY